MPRLCKAVVSNKELKGEVVQENKHSVWVRICAFFTPGTCEMMNGGLVKLHKRKHKVVMDA